jgi:endonuclease YncB( thermonuclease family)
MFWKARLAVLPVAVVAAGIGAYALGPGKHDNLSPFPGEPVRALSVRVVDGDTVVIAGERVRLSDLDAPEMPGRARCQREVQLAVAAKVKLTTILSVDGADIRLLRDLARPKDRYGRTLGRIIVNGEDVAAPLIAAGVARPWRGRSSNWCGPND